MSERWVKRAGVIVIVPGESEGVAIPERWPESEYIGRGWEVGYEQII
jgi:hypothetical protein